MHCEIIEIQQKKESLKYFLVAQAGILVPNWSEYATDMFQVFLIEDSVSKIQFNIECLGQ